MSEEKPIEQMTVEEAKGEIDRRLEDFESDYWQNDRPGHKRAVDEMRRLHETAWPSRGEERNRGLTQRLEEEGITSVEDVEKIAAEKKTGDDEGEVELTNEEKEGLANLEKEWGEEYEANLNVAQGAYEGVAKQYGDDDFRALIDGGLGNDPAIIRLFHKIGKESQEALSNLSCPHCGEKITGEEE